MDGVDHQMHPFITPAMNSVPAFKPCWNRSYNLRNEYCRFPDAQEVIQWLQSGITNCSLGSDAIALYCMLSIHRPAQYFEIGAGHSTRFARRAITDGALRTSIICIDPAPRLTVQAVADHVVTSPLESVDLGIFDGLN
jgi:hypothetical protein